MTAHRMVMSPEPQYVRHDEDSYGNRKVKGTNPPWKMLSTILEMYAKMLGTFYLNIFVFFPRKMFRTLRDIEVLSIWACDVICVALFIIHYWFYGRRFTVDDFCF